MTSAILAAGCGRVNDKNPLLETFGGLHGTPPFSEIRVEHYMPAFKTALSEAREEVRGIVESTEPATFANTIEALENSGGRLNRISDIFFNLNEAETSEKMQAIALEVAPMLTEFSNDIQLDPVLYARVKTVYDSRGELGLTTEQNKLLEKTYKGFVRSGAALNDADKETYRKISAELSELSLKFNQNLLAATNAWFLTVADRTDVDELPDFVKEAAAEEASAKNAKGWVFTLQAPSMTPFMTYSSNRKLKEQLWRAYNSRAFGGEYDNTKIVKRIAELRLNAANLLGYETYADYVLEERMAESKNNVNDFLAKLLGRAVDAARNDVEAVSEYARAMGADFELMPWDFAYYAEKLKEDKYSVSDELTKPYFMLEKAQEGAFGLAGRLYGLTFTENPNIDVYHPDVKAFEVRDRNDRFMGVLYMDFFPRDSKRGGAWMTEFRPQYFEDGEEIRPLISVVCNFTKPTATMPSLLTFGEVETLLHEFGHALHGLLAEGHYASLTGTSVYRDFVELPSQIMENWAYEKEFLDLWASHYETEEKIPAELVQKLLDARNFNAAYSHVRQVSFGLGDMAWHSITDPVEAEVNEFEKQAIIDAQVLPYVDGQCMATGFSHIFSGGYAAGYYSYKWAEVLEADAYSLFEKNGIFDTATAESFRENVLSRGGTEHPKELYTRFRGQEPDVESLFRKMGF